MSRRDEQSLPSSKEEWKGPYVQPNQSGDLPSSPSATRDGNTVEAICGPSQLVKIDDGQSVHVRTAREWLDLARADLSARSETAPLVAGDLAKQREIHDTYAPVSATPTLVPDQPCPTCKQRVRW